MLAQTDSAGTEHPIVYYSRKMFPRECRYSSPEQEGLAVVEACKYFLPYFWDDHSQWSQIIEPSASSLRRSRQMEDWSGGWTCSGNSLSPSSISQENQIKMLTPSRQAWIDDRPAQDSPEEGEDHLTPSGLKPFEYIT